jgi:hypothetical protein
MPVHGFISYFVCLTDNTLDTHTHTHIYIYSRITYTQSLSFFMATFSVSEMLWSFYHSNVIALTVQADRYWHLHCCDCRNTLICAHMTSCTLLICDISLSSLMVPVPEAGYFVELILLYICMQMFVSVVTLRACVVGNLRYTLVL